MNSRIVRLLALSLMLLLPFAAHPATLFVSPDGSGADGLSWETAFPTVHAAMLTASSGDHVWVRSATYAGDIRMATGVSLFGGFAGTEASNEFHLRDWKINPTVLSGGTPVVTAADETVIDGFVVRDGIADTPGGAGILVRSVHADIKNCLITKNGLLDDASTYGIGIYCDDATIGIIDSSVHSNRRGIALRNSSGVVRSTTIANNVAEIGGGISISNNNNNYTLHMIDCLIVENRAENHTGTGARGGGIHAINARLILDRCVIARNVAKGAIVPFGGGSDGGAIYSLANVDATLTNCLIEGNMALRGNVFSSVQDVSFHLINSTVTKNKSETGLGSLFDLGGGSKSTFLALNSIILGNEKPFGGGTNIPDRFRVLYSNTDIKWIGEGNIDADPMFVDPENGNFRLMRGSPCIDSGTDTGLTHDLDGNPRPIGRYDMGAYEFPFLRSDINGDGVVDALDLLIFSEDWKKVSGP